MDFEGQVGDCSAWPAECPATRGFNGKLLVLRLPSPRRQLGYAERLGVYVQHLGGQSRLSSTRLCPARREVGA